MDSHADCAAAYAYCERLAREHYENFPVASRLLPPSMRPHIAAVYAFARRADDFADEPGIDDAERLRLLTAWERRLHGDFTIRIPRSTWRTTRFSRRLHTPFGAAGFRFRCFTDLLSAFRQDISTNRYKTWADVLDYCRRSANPVGRLVLRIAGYEDSSLDAQSDALCTALQLTNFWQDLAIDWRKGRCTCLSMTGIAPAPATRISTEDGSVLNGKRRLPRWRCGQESLFDAGRPVCDGVRGRLRWELRFTWLGASLILDRLERVRFDVFRRRPRLVAADALPLAWRALRWSPARDPARTTPTPDPVERSGPC